MENQKDWTFFDLFSEATANPYNLEGEKRFSKREFPTTETELRDMATAANTGFKRTP